jgi:Ras association domain-containing protein 7/8
MLAEVDRLQLQVEQAKHDAEMAAQIGDTLHKEVRCPPRIGGVLERYHVVNELLLSTTQVAVLEATINEKKRQVEKLVADMKEANLQSLAISPPEELKMILDGE